MTFQQLTCFVTTARCGSFNAAARSLHLSQPAVSEHVRRLEADLGAVLVQRHGRGLVLTADGRSFLAHAERLLAAREEASLLVGRRARRSGAVLTLGVTRNAPHYDVDELVADVAAELPDARLRLPGDNSIVLADAVRSGDLDAALVILPVEPRGLTVNTLFRDEVLFVSNDIVRVAQPMTIDRLVATPLILYDTAHGFGDPTRHQLLTRAQAAGITLEPRFDVEHVETAVELTAMGLGDTIAARSVTRRSWFRAGLHVAEFADPLYDHFAVITRAGPGPVGPMRSLLSIVERWGARAGERLNH